MSSTVPRFKTSPVLALTLLLTLSLLSLVETETLALTTAEPSSDRLADTGCTCCTCRALLGLLPAALAGAVDSLVDNDVWLLLV